MDQAENNWHLVTISGLEDLQIEVESANPTEELEEIRSFISGLVARGSVMGVGPKTDNHRLTHELTMGPNGYLRVVRVGFAKS